MPTYYVPTDPAFWIYASCSEEGEACAEEMTRRLREYAAENSLLVSIETTTDYRNHEYDSEVAAEYDAVLKLNYYFRTIPLWDIQETVLAQRKVIAAREIEAEKERARKLREAGLDKIQMPLPTDERPEPAKPRSFVSGVPAPKQVSKPKKTRKNTEEQQAASDAFFPVFNG